MPMTWIKPEIFMVYNGTTIFHTYINGVEDAPSKTVYTASIIEDEDYNFDASTLPLPIGCDDITDAELRIKLAIQYAIATDGIPLPYIFEEDPSEYYGIKGTVQSDDGKHEFGFDASQYFAQAPINELLSHYNENFNSPHQSDQFTEYMTNRDYNFNSLLFCINNVESDTDHCGFKAFVDEPETVMDWLKEYRTDVYWQLRCLAGTAKRLTGAVNEEVNLSKRVYAYIETDVNGNFIEDPIEIISDKAYEKNLLDCFGSHEWDSTTIEEPHVSWKVCE